MTTKEKKRPARPTTMLPRLIQRSAYLLVFLLFPLLSCCSNLRLAPRTAAPAASSAFSAFAPDISDFLSLPLISVPTNPSWESSTPTSTRTIPTDAAGYFSAVASAVPACVDSAPSLCPTLYAAATECWSSAESPECFCSNLTQTTCTQICNRGEEPEAYILWVTSACNQSSSNEAANPPPQFKSWADENYFRALALEHLLPWNWTVQYDPKDDHRPPGSQKPKSCPSTFSKLGSFALINLLVLMCTLVFFRRTVIYKLTCRKCGRPGSPMWLFTGMLSAGLLVASNYANAAIVRSTPGYLSVPVTQLMLLWCSRPRISWVAVLLIWVQKEQSM
jgi:hypothetical protein